ncbi:MAG: glycosyltransferase [Bacteroidia bacterium]|nr:glycosyltransferase [Bacteroidia bacterium]
MQKPTFIIFIDWYLPAYKAGGPVQSVSNIVARLKNQVQFKIITSAYDLNETQTLPNIEINCWTKAPDGTDIYYLDKGAANYSNVKKLLSSLHFDGIYLNSFFSIPFTLYPINIVNRYYPQIKIILAPRGMLAAQALQLKAFKKKLFISVVKVMNLFHNVIWHASTILEQAEIKNVLPQANVLVALNLSKQKDVIPKHRTKTENELRLAFLSRISPKKNLKAVYDYLKAVDTKYKISFTYFGPADDAAYFDECKQLFDNLPTHITANYGGAIQPDEITNTLQSFHAFILPTLNENFGHAIVESWLAGCIAIISDNTPWQGLVEKGVGYNLPLNQPDSFVSALESVSRLDQINFNSYQNHIYVFAQQIINNNEALEQNVKLFIEAK